MRKPLSFIACYRRPFVVAAGVLVLGLMLTLTVGAMPGYDSPDPVVIQQTVDDALDYVKTQQMSDGGIDAWGYGLGSDMGATCRALLALAASGRSTGALAHSQTGATAVDYFRDHVVSYTHASGQDDSASLFPTQAGLALAAASAAVLDPTTVGGMDLIGQIQECYIAANGTYSTSVAEGYNNGWASDLQQSWVIFGLSVAGVPVPEKATDWLIGQQAPNGTWYNNDLDITALAVLGLVGSGNVSPSHEAVQKAIQFLRGTQLSTGGWRPTWDADDLNVGTTAWVVQALLACGYTPPTASWAGSPNPLDAIVSMAKPSGCIGGTYANAYSTLEAVLGLAPQALTTLGSGSRARRALAWAHTMQDGTGGFPGDLPGPDMLASCDAVLAHVAAGYDPDTVMAPSGESLLDYVRANAETFAQGRASDAGRVIVALAAAGSDPTDVDGVDLVQLLDDTWWDDGIGAFGAISNTWDQAYGILGLAAAGGEVPPDAVQALIALQEDGGGWKHEQRQGYSVMVDSSAVALQALIAAGQGRESPVVQEAIAYLRAEQRDENGTWSRSAMHTACAIMGLSVAGEDLEAEPYLTDDGISPRRALEAMQQPSGAFVSDLAGGPEDLFSTLKAVQALSGLRLPHAPGTLRSWADVSLGPDPNRYVAVAPRILGVLGTSLMSLPFGSDLDGDATVEALYRTVGATEWQADAEVTRENGYYTISLNNAGPAKTEYRITVTDPDGVQYGTAAANDVTFQAVLPQPLFVPMVAK